VDETIEEMRRRRWMAGVRIGRVGRKGGMGKGVGDARVCFIFSSTIPHRFIETDSWRYSPTMAICINRWG